MKIIKGDREIHDEWENYYKFLENLRQSGITNMYGASPYLEDAYDLNREEAITVLSNWMTNYTELCKKYNWRSDV